MSREKKLNTKITITHSSFVCISMKMALIESENSTTPEHCHWFPLHLLALSTKLFCQVIGKFLLTFSPYHLTAIFLTNLNIHQWILDISTFLYETSFSKENEWSLKAMFSFSFLWTFLRWVIEQNNYVITYVCIPKLLGLQNI